MITPSFSITATEHVLPNLALDFTTANLDPRITFTRSGNTATVINSSGFVASINANLPRFDYNPVTLVCNGLLVEESRSNFVKDSSDYSTANWVRNRSTIASSAVVSPDGSTTALLIFEDTAFGAHGVSAAPASSVAIGATYTMSVFAKAGTNAWAIVNFIDTTAIQTYFNLSTGAIGNIGAGCTATITPYGGGWYRCSVTKTMTTSSLTYQILTTRSNGLYTYTGAVDRGGYFWGSQLELGAFSTSYIPTTTVALTRNADVATITGTNFSEFWQASKGGAQVQAIPSTVSGIRPLVQYDDNTSDNIIALRGNAADSELQIVASGTPQVQLDAGTIVANTAYSLTGWWDTNNCKARQNAGAVVTDTTATIPTVTQARLGSDGTNYLNGHLATINYYDSFFGQPIYTRRKNKVFSSLL